MLRLGRHTFGVALAGLVALCCPGVGQADDAGRPALPSRYEGTGQTPACRTTGELHRGGRQYRVVVHFSRKGRDRVPPVDRDRTGVPDIVECAASAASRALEVYARLGFRTPKGDRAGGNARPDIYLVRRDLDTESSGVTLRDRRGGVYIVISTRLTRDLPGVIAGPVGTYIPPNPRVVRDNLWFVTAHEAFHVVQNAYMPGSAIPAWIREGSANSLMLAALYDRAFPLDVQADLDVWLGESFRPITYAGQNCAHCYGQGVFWYWLNHPPGDAHTVRLLFERLAARRAAGTRLGDGMAAMSEALALKGGDLGAVLLQTTLWYAGVGLGTPGSWAILPEAEDLKPSSTQPQQFAWIAPPWSAARIRIPVEQGRPPAAVPLAVRVAAPELLPIVYVGLGVTRISPAAVDESTGLWVYDIPTDALPYGCTGPCRPGFIDLIMQNVSGRRIPYALTYGLRSPP
jgi:hypothetical protein